MHHLCCRWPAVDCLKVAASELAAYRPAEIKIDMHLLL